MNSLLPSERSIDYAVDTRPLCQDLPFVLTDVAHPRTVLKYGSHFLVLDQLAIVPDCNTLGYGYYRYDTRHLSQWELTLNDMPVSLLSMDDNKGYSASFLYTNLKTDEIPQQKLKILRQVLLDDLLWERLCLENYGSKSYDVILKIKFRADFADMFEVRGLNRPVRGERMVPVAAPDLSSLFLAYRGQDGCLFETVIEFLGRRPDQIADGEAIFALTLPAREEVQLDLKVLTRWDGQSACNSHSGEDAPASLTEAGQLADQSFQQWCLEAATVETEHDLVNLSLARSFRDLYILRQPSPKGYGLAAGIPWYTAIFGRDSAITALQMLPYAPDLARQCIEVLANYQGREHNTFREEEPGRIMHELRLGELARLGTIPHSPYYGTVDATQLWLMLLSEYLKWTGDLDFVIAQWPAVKLALNWIDSQVEKGNGYIAYKRESAAGLANQGWKDSGDSIMHASGELAEPPIACCEAQAYLYAAWTGISQIADLLGHRQLSNTLFENADRLKTRFRTDFWMEKQKYVALALDGSGHQTQVVSSNPGHCLWTGILEEDQAQAVADRLMSDELYSGWGIRTLSSQAVAYSPLSYHNGSVWPHDNAIIAEGLRKLGRVDDVHRLLSSVIEAAHYQAGYRLPELFCGFERKGGGLKPVDYPVSCSPQAWAAGAVFQMISACLNWQPDALNQRVRIVDPMLPDWFGKMTVSNVKLGNASFDMALANSKNSTFCQILRKTGRVRIIVEN